jgi:hypothetical protein
MHGPVASVCRHVLEGAPILYAARDDVAEAAACEWRFRCGAPGDDDGEGRVVPLDDVVRRDPSAVEIVLHPRGTALERRAPAMRWRLGTGPVLFPHRPSRRYPRFDPRYPPRPGEALDAGDLRLISDVAQWGVHVAVPDEDPRRAFSVGLFRSWDHPEVAVFGLAPHELADAVWRVAARIRHGDRFEHGDVADGIVAARAVTFRRIVPRHYAAVLGHGVWYHGGARFPALQVVWADADGRFPWDRWFPRELRDAQPVLFEPEPA